MFGTFLDLFFVPQISREGVVYCSSLQFVAVCCSALQRVADVLQCDAACCNVFQYVALHLVCCSALYVLQCVAVWSSVL